MTHTTDLRHANLSGEARKGGGVFSPAPSPTISQVTG